MNTFGYKRIVVIGTTASGKSTLAKEISQKLSLDLIELDALHWEANWKEVDDVVFRERVQKAIRTKSWVSAGNYTVVGDLLWGQAEVIVWLDYPFHIIFWRLLTRTIRRIITQEELWNGNRERLSTQLKIWSEESIIHWFFKTYWHRKRQTPILVSEHKHLKLIHFKHPKQAKEWLQSL